MKTKNHCFSFSFFFFTFSIFAAPKEKATEGSEEGFKLQPSDSGREANLPFLV